MSGSAGGRRFVELVVASHVASGPDLVECLGSGDEVSSRGDITMSRGRQRIEEDSTWVIRSGEDPSAPIDRHLDALWKRGHDALTKLSTTPSLRAQCLLRVVQYLDASEYQGHGLNLSADWVRLLAAVDAQIDIDQYVE